MDEDALDDGLELEEVEDAGAAGEGKDGAAGAPQGEKPDGDKGAAPAADSEVKRLKSELKAERSRSRENEQAARYWADQARAASGRRVADPEPDPDDELEEIDLVSEIT